MPDEKAVSNDTVTLVPQPAAAERQMSFDFPAIQIGVAEYREGPTGCTVFYFPRGATVACDVRGGMPGTIMTAPDGFAHAICFAGGSLLGLEAATGVSAELFAMKGFSTDHIPVVRGAIIYDYHSRSNRIYPDKALGRAALKNAQTGVFPLGRHGAGCSAGVGAGLDFKQGESAGQGGAFRQAGETKVAVFTVINAIGAILNREGKVVRGHLDRATGIRRPLSEQVEQLIAHPETDGPTRHTTLTIVVTNQKLEATPLTQLARQVHNSLARAIQPFHTGFDGDALFAVTTGEVENSKLTNVALGVVASELAWDAVLSCFEE
jgi:L-aminopeptidase/D-esterase-like protein